MGENERLYLVDGTALAYRSHFAFARNPLVNSRGLETSAAFGFATTIVRLLEEERPTLVAVAWDSEEPTFRHKAFEAYKATRERMPDPLVAQIPYIEALVRALGLPFLAVPGYEADDIMATLAVRGAERGYEVFLVTADKDLMQVVGPRVRMLNLRKTAEREVLGPAEVEAKFGVPPERIRDLLALMGDTSDNIPGVPGVGEKTAAKLLREHGSLEAVLGAAQRIKGALGMRLLEHREEALLSMRLATVDTAVPLPCSLEDLRVGRGDPARLRELFMELEFQGLLKAVSGDESTDAHVYHVVEGDAEFEGLARRLEAAKEFAFDSETTGLDPLRVDIVGLSFAVEPGEAWYVPAQPERDLFGRGDDLLRARLARLKPILEDEARAKGGQNVKYDMLALSRYGVEVRGVSFDTLLESYLLDPGARQHNLDVLALKYLNWKKIPTEALIGKGKKQVTMAEVPVAEVARYACEDADVTLRLHRRFGPMLADLGLERLYREVEVPLVSVLARMERTGVAVDTALLARLSKEFDDRLRETEREVYGLAGEEFNISSPKQLGPILFEKLEVQKALGVRVRRTPTGAYSTDEEVLSDLAEHPLPGKILEYRSLQKLKGTYVDALPQLVNPHTGRIHTSYNQAVAATGRLSSSDPNLQNIPIRTEDGKRIREAFVPGEPGWVLLSADYSQVELRLLAHMSGDETLTKAFRDGEDIHRATAARVFGVAPEAVTGDLRGRAKAINFGIIYGMGPQRLARETGLSLDEAQRFIDGYFGMFPGVKAYIDRALAEARATGMVTTILGRKRQIAEIWSPNRGLASNAERLAVNTPIQGSAADLIKVAMIAIDRRLAAEKLRARMLLQVHDELVFECPETEKGPLSALVVHEMEHALDRYGIPLSVPLGVSVGAGRNWLEAH